MLKFLRLGVALIAVLATPISTAFLTSPANAANVTTLNAQLKQSVCTQNWEEAVKIVDKMIALTPLSNQRQYNELQTSRVRMQNLSVSRTNVDSWLESYCTTPVATPAVATNTTVIKAFASSSTSTDRAFIENYKQLVMHYPDVKTLLLSHIKNSSNLIVNSAKSTCNVLRAGSSLNELTELEAKVAVNITDPHTEKAYITNVAIVDTLAPQYYCPEFDNR